MTRLIGLIGKKRTGKNHTARLLGRFGYREAAFADPLRDMAVAIDPVIGWDRFTDRPIHYTDALNRYGYEAAKERFPEFRRFLQRLGTEGVRETLGEKYGLRELLGDDVWIVLAEKRIDSSDERLVFTDVRFPNEAELIRRKGGATVRVVRPDLPPSTDEHPSEIALDDYEPDATLHNDSTPAGLSEAVDALVDKIAA